MITADGRHLTHDTSVLWPSVDGRRRRSAALSEDDINIRLMAFGQHFQLHLQLNKNMLASGPLLEEKFSSASDHVDQEIPRHVAGCFLRGSLRNVVRSPAAIYVCGKGLVSTGMKIACGLSSLFFPFLLRSSCWLLQCFVI